MPRTRRRPWPVRAARAVAIAILGVAVLYLLGANVFLSTGLFERVVNADPETLDVHYARAWSPWPGRVHARALRIRSTDSNVEWSLAIDDIDFDVSLLALLHRRFEASHLRGRGVALRLRQKLDALPTAREQVEDLPPIEGLPGFGVRAHVEDTNAVWDDAYWHLWTVRLEDVVSEETREIWIDHERFVGRARVTGGFYLRPMRAADAGPVHVEVEHGDVLRGRSRVLQGVRGSLDASVSTFDPRTTHGLELLRHVTVAGDVRAERASPRGLGAIAEGLHVEGRSTPEATRIELDAWVAAPLGDTRFAGLARAILVARGLGGDVEAVDLTGSELALEDVAAHGVPADAIRWHGRVTARRAAMRLGDERLDASLVLDARDARPIVAALLGDRLPPIFADATDVPHLEASARVALAPGLLYVSELVARGGDITAAGTFASRPGHRHGAFVLEKASVAGGLGIDDDGVHVRFGDLAGWMQGEQRRVEELAGARPGGATRAGGRPARR